MQSLVEFLEQETNKKINIFKYNKQTLKKNHKLVKFNNVEYVFELNDRFELDNIKGYTYLIYQNNLDFNNLKNVLYNLYENIVVFEYNKYIILNSNIKLDINENTHQIIESETYCSTCIAYLGNINDTNSFDYRVDILNEFINLNSSIDILDKFITLNDLLVYKYISSISKDSSIYNLIDSKYIKSLDKDFIMTGIKFLENDLNISKTSSDLFLHRNTLIYRLEKIKETLSLDLRNFKDAFIFYIMIKSYFKNKF